MRSDKRPSLRALLICLSLSFPVLYSVGSEFVNLSSLQRQNDLFASGSRVASTELHSSEILPVTVPPAESVAMEERARRFGSWSGTHGQIDPSGATKYLLWLPHDGLNNQRRQLENVLVLCRVLKRTCVLPMAARHTRQPAYINKTSGVNGELLPWDEFINLDALSKPPMPPIVPLNMTLRNFVQRWKRDPPSDGNKKLSWRIITTKELCFTRTIDCIKKNPRAYRAPMRSIKDIKRILGPYNKESVDVLYILSHSLTFYGMPPGAVYKEKREVLDRIQPASQIMRVALQAACEMNATSYSAAHVRLGDYSTYRLTPFVLLIEK